MTSDSAKLTGSTSESLVSFSNVEGAADRIRNVASMTPLLRSTVLDQRTGATVLIKAENLQRSGSFKFRGAYNCLSQIPADKCGNGVVSCSSGNHAQGVAASADLLGIPATIIMPSDAPQIKLERTKGYGAKVVTYDRAKENREAIAEWIGAETNATFVHPYNDPAVIAGQGTVGLEMVAHAKELGCDFDDVFVSTSGGGLSSGIALVLAERSPTTKLHTVEPAGFDDYKRSLEAGARLANPSKSGSICDALLSESPGEIGFSILNQLAGAGVTVTDDEVLHAVAFAFTELKLVVEPGGAAALAAVLFGKFPIEGKTIGLVLTGGNIDPRMLLKAVDR
ncbi:MAG: threonine/serine dehydratase [Roseibium sp.]